MAAVGPHLLGRRPTTPDERDFRAANFVGIGAEVDTTEDPATLIAAGVNELKLTTITYRRWAATVYLHPEQAHWWKAFDYFARAQALIHPPAPPPTGDVIWADPDAVLDQGNTPHCGGFGGAQWGNTDPVEDHYGNTDGHALYYEAVAIGGYPKSEDGVQSRWVAQALLARKRLQTYAFASSVAEVRAWIQSKGPVMVGTDWTTQMFSPDADGFVSPSDGDVAGGHFYVLVGDLSAQNAFLCLNSWGAGWGQDGRFKITHSDFQTLLDGISWAGDAIVSVELPL